MITIRREVVVVHKLDKQLDGNLQYIISLLAKLVNNAGETVTEADKALARDIRDQARAIKLSVKALDEKTPSAAEPGVNG